jgi:hypothetical protein
MAELGTQDPASGEPRKADPASTGASTGLWVGATVSFLLASFGMVQIRDKFFGGYSSGDWPNHPYTWHFIPSLAGILAAWYVAGRIWSHRRGLGIRSGLGALGAAASPMLGLTVAWTWYGLIDERYHPYGGCHIPVLCHDVWPSSVIYWATPWIVLGAIQLWRVWRS